MLTVLINHMLACNASSTCCQHKKYSDILRGLFNVISHVATMQIILMAGLQGVGKTTACGKLALFLRKQKKKVLMVATDVYRPAAIEQLVKLGERIKVPVFEQGTDAKPEAIAAAGVKHVSLAL